jgi:hypothetical protein
VLEHRPLLLRRRPDHHRALELGEVAPDRRACSGDENVARLKGDVRGQRVGDRRVAADLSAVAGTRPVEERILRAVDRSDRIQHCQRRLVARALRDLDLRQPRPRVALQQDVREIAPLRALAD